MSLGRIACAFAVLLSTPAFGAETPGVTKTEIKIGGIFPFSGPASSVGLVGKGVLAYVQSINDRGGINGRKIEYIAYDDAYSPPKAVEQARKLVESDEIAFMFGQAGTPTNAAVAKYFNRRHVPSVGIVSGAAKFTNSAEYPLTTTSVVSFDTEGKIYAKYLAKRDPGAKYAILYQNDDLGRDYLNAFKEVLGANFTGQVVAVSYESTDPTVDSQIVSLKSSGAQALMIAGTPKFAAQAIRKTSEIGWKPTLFINYPSGSVGATLKPAGLDKSFGVIVGAISMDPTDSQWDDDQGMKDYRNFLAKYMPGADIAEASYLLGYIQGHILERLIRQCGEDLSRENVIKQAKNLKDVAVPTLLPGVTINTSEQNNMNFTQMRLQRWTGTRWELFTDVLDATSK